MNAIIPLPLTLFLPWLAGLVAAWLTSAKLTKLFNGIIIGVLFAMSVALCYFTAGQLSGNLTTDLTLIIGYSAGTFGLMRPLMDFLSIKIPSPFALLAPAAAQPVTPPPSKP